MILWLLIRKAAPGGLYTVIQTGRGRENKHRKEDFQQSGKL